MEKVTPVQEREKKTVAGFISRNKKDLILAGILLAGFGYVFTSTPLSQIMWGANLGTAFGLPSQALGQVTPMDLSLYASGLNRGKVEGILSSVEEENDYSKGTYLFGSISPFEEGDENRLLNAQKEFSKDVESAKSALGQIEGPLSLADTFNGPARVEGVPVAATGEIDGSVPADDRLKEEAKAGGPVRPLGTLEDSATSRFNAKDLQGKPKSGENIQGKAQPESFFSKTLTESAAKFSNGRVGSMGGFNVVVGRIKTDKLDVSQLNAFTDLGRAFFFSRSGVRSPFSTSAKQLVAAAFDGSEQEEEMLVIPDEKEEIYIGGDPRPPSTVVLQMQESMQRCKEARAQHQQAADDAVTEITKQIGGIQQIIEENKGRVPGSCDRVLGIEFTSTADARDKWNKAIENISTQCTKVDEQRTAYFDGCGFTYEADPIEIPYTCSYIQNMTLEGGCGFGLCQFTCAGNPHWFDSKKFNCEDASDCKAKMEKKLREIAHFMVTAVRM